VKSPRFTLDMFGDGLEWTKRVQLDTPARKYRVVIEWKLDHYQLTVWCRLAEPEVLVRARACTAWYDYTAIERANKLLRAYSRREAGWSDYTKPLA